MTTEAIVDASSETQKPDPSQQSVQAPAMSVTIPVHNGAATLGQCLDALAESRGVTWECIVVDDGCTDHSAEVAHARQARVVRTAKSPLGPAQARTLGAVAATAPLLCFVDADVLVRPDTLAQFFGLFEADPHLVAAFGSYDSVPAAPGLLSQYRNLLHHFVHQSGHEAASTFWAGCGAIRRNAFLDIGGFDARYTRPSVEDIELGYRLHAAGARIRLAKHIQVTHLKRWSFWGIIRTDIRDRSVPWTALITRTRQLPDDLNVNWPSRTSAVAVCVPAGILLVGWREASAWGLAVLPLGVLLACNRRLYAFLLRERGAWFLLRVLPMHWLYFAYSALTFAGYGMVGAVLRWLTRRTTRQPASRAASLRSLRG
jgi:glycosyltransferase involved in cell wall biosynthesis